MAGIRSVDQQLTLEFTFIITAEHAGKTGHQRRFSGTGSTQQQHTLPRLYGEVHMP